MICPECGSYQPDRAKFCGICGTPLSQESLVENFLRERPEQEIRLPRFRSPWFYLSVFLLLALTLALLAGAVYLVYRAARGGEEKAPEEGEAQEYLQYFDESLGFGFSYPRGWMVEKGYATGEELTSLRVVLTSRKYLEIKAFVLDPVVSVGGLEGIREFLEQKAAEHVRSLGGTVQDEGESLLTYTRVGEMPAFYLEFEANLMGEATSFFLQYVVSDDFCFQFEGRSPSEEIRGVRPLFWSIADSLYRRQPELSPGSGSGGEENGG